MQPDGLYRGGLRPEPVTQAITATLARLSFAYVLPQARVFHLRVHAFILPRPGIEISGRRAVQASFRLASAARTAASVGMSATLVNLVETY